MKRYPPAPITIVFAGIPIGVAYAQLPPITVAMRTAFGSAPSSVAMLSAIGTRRAVVAVLLMKFVRIQAIMKITNVSMNGEGLDQQSPMTASATIAPAPLVSRASARARVPPKRKIVCMSMLLYACFSVMTPVRTRRIAPIHPET